MSRKLSKEEFVTKFMKDKAKKKKESEAQYTSYYCDLRSKIKKRLK